MSGAQKQVGVGVAGDAAAVKGKPPVGGLVWAARILALAGFGLALFLSAIALGVMPGDDLPGCGISRWVDCSSVLGDARYSRWFDAPVAVPAASTYLILLVALWGLGMGRGMGRWISVAAATLIALAAIWFIYVQLAVLGKVCPYCMTEHAIGLTLFVIVLLAARRKGGPLPISGLFAAVVGIAALIAAQVFVEPTLRYRVIPGEGRRLTEEAPPGKAVVILDGFLQLNRDWHIYLGPDDPDDVLVEILDYTCPHCLELHEILDEAIAQSGYRIGVLVLTYPLNNACNPNSGPPDPGFERACDLAALAHAVRVIDPSKSKVMHDWFFENQRAIRDGTLTMEQVLAEAGKLVDRGELERLMGDDEQAPTMVRIDIDRSRRLFPDRLPLPMMVMHSDMIRLPPTAEELAGVLRQAVRPAPAPAPAQAPGE